MGMLFDSIVLGENQMIYFNVVLSKKTSAVVCTSMLKETIEYYIQNYIQISTDCYLLLLNASKAFGRWL